MPEKSEKYQAVIGLEVHAQLNTESKLFSADPNRFGAEANQHISEISLGHPGSLPRLNKEAVKHAIRFGLAVHSDIASSVTFSRKNYFYTDLPKGYQISQHESPICEGGRVSIRLPEGMKTVQLTRIHIEEDAGKSLHRSETTCIDLNRAGVPLLEIVTEPDLSSGEEASAYLTEIRRLVRFLGVSDGNMEEGSLRCDANVSVRKINESRLGTRTEIKNLNSITNVRKAIEFEIERQCGMLDKGEKVIQQTMSYDEQGNATFPLRSKEEADDYRYFPEPDLNPYPISKELLEEIQSGLPVLPEEIFRILTEEQGLPGQDALILIDTPEFADYYMNLSRTCTDVKMAANWMIGPVRSWLNENRKSMDDFPLQAEQLAALITLVKDGKVSYSAAQQKIFPQMIQSPGKRAWDLAIELNLVQESGEEFIMKQVQTALNMYPDKIKEYHQGKKGLLGLFMGEVMKLSGGRADPSMASRIIVEELNKRK